MPIRAAAGGVPAGTCAVSRLDGVRTVIGRAVRVEEESRGGTADVDREWHAAIRALGSILGAEPPSNSEDALRGQLRAVLQGDVVSLPCDAGAPARDRLAYRLSLIGYSLDDIARVTSGGATKAALDRDERRRAVGLPPAPLESRASMAFATPVPVPADGLNVSALRPTWDVGSGHETLGVPRLAAAIVLAAARPPAAVAAASIRNVGLRVPAAAPPVMNTPVPSPAVIEWWMRYYALSYGVDYRLVAAVIRQESNGQTDSVSDRGAVGLMQLMPATAAMLRVNPRDPIDNLRGGIAYLAGLLSSYRSVRTALIAYNAGPAHADSVVRGERQPYPETQRYLQAVDAIYPIDQRR